MPRYVITLRKLEAEHGITVDDLLDKGIVGKVAAERMRAGKCKAIRASTINAVCELADCGPEILFEQVERS